MTQKEQLESLQQLAKQISTRTALIHPKDFSFSVEDDGFRLLRCKEDVVEEIRWKDVTQIEVECTSDGDLLWLFFVEGKEQPTVVPLENEMQGHEKLLEKILSLDDFDHSAFLSATSSSSDEHFKLWTKNN